MKQATPLEQAVLQKLLEGPNVILERLREQLLDAEVTARKFTGVGFYTRFKISRQTARVPGIKSSKLDDLIADIPGVETGAGFLLSIKDGLINELEGYTYGGETWPSEIQKFELKYSTGGERDLNELSRLIGT